MLQLAPSKTEDCPPLKSPESEKPKVELRAAQSRDKESPEAMEVLQYGIFHQC
jgi:hypothetical protein